MAALIAPERLPADESSPAVERPTSAGPGWIFERETLPEPPPGGSEPRAGLLSWLLRSERLPEREPLDRQGELHDDTT